MLGRSEVLEEFFISLQEAMWRILSRSWESVELDNPRRIASVDIAYRGDLALAVAVCWDLERGEPVEERWLACETPYPYVPGLLFLREAPLMLRAVKLLEHDWSLLLVDGHGLLHPRRMGLAVILGLVLGKPALGVAKSLLVGVEGPGEDWGPVEVSGEVLGYWFKTEGGGKFYVSPGYMLTVDHVPKLVRILGSRYPEPLAYADKLSRRLARSWSP
ncbi:MAG: endonuclease V [Thaumarchaeota archaeon]|jgi:deoxyribonuclease V|nr:endonuclease V [Candidatus Wolframiiraptor allenii]